MDSGNNSGSLQSSSGGAPADEFDSQPHFIFPSTSTTPITNSSNHLSFFDPLSNLLSPPAHPPAHPPAPPPAPAPRRSKKRTRASRRAPTTVLTTDTSNFRAMVQEFTGIPSPPFPSSSSVTSSSAYPRSLFNPAPFLLKPYPQKFQHHPPPTNFSYQLPSSSNSNLLSFQSLLHSQLTAPPPKSTSSAADQYGAADIGSLPGVNIGSTGWGQEHAVNPTQLRQQQGGVSNSSCKMNYSAPGSMPLAPEFGAEKGGEARGSEGMLESWICSSD